MTVFLSTVRTPRMPHRPAKAQSFLMTALAVWSERRALARFDASRLRDLGITPQQAAAEAARPFWDIPHRGTR